MRPSRRPLARHAADALPFVPSRRDRVTPVLAKAARRDPDADGRLAPPRFLRIIDGYEALQEQWAAAAEELRQERRPSDEALVALEATVAEWSVAVRPPANAARPVDRREALAWLNRLALFVRDLDDAQLEDLGRFIQNAGHTFAGGTVGELLTFLIDQARTGRYRALA